MRQLDRLLGPLPEGGTAAVAFVDVARQLRHRPASPAGERALRSFAVW